MNRLNIRWRLTLWYGGVLAVVLACFGTAVYFIMRHHLLQRIDAGLTEELAELEAVVARHDNAAALKRRLSERFTRHEGYEFQVTTAASRPLFLSQEISASPLPVPDVTSSRSDAAWANVTLGDSGHWRVASRSVPGPDGKLVIQAARSLARYDHELGELLAVLLVTGPVTLVVALGGGYVLARRALAPVDRMTRTAQQITAEKLDQRIEVANPDDELGQLAATLNAMIERLERSFQEMRRFTADAAHELRTPLTVLRNETEVALRAPRSPEEHRRVLENLLEETERLSRLADRLLFLCRQDAGLQPSSHAPVRIDELLGEVAEHMRAVAESRGVSLTLDHLPAAEVEGDADQLRRLFYNLLDNALRYTPEGGTVAVAGRVSGESVVLSVCDTGSGIPPAHLPHVFERFYRVDAARSDNGSGLGLSICKAIVEAHGGTINVQSTIGEGTEVRVHLPRNRETQGDTP